MLDTIIGALADVLTQGGINAVQEYPGTRPVRRNEPVVCVGVKSGRLTGSGMGEYMGTDKTDGREIYALRLELVIGMDIFAPVDYDGGCISVLEKISSLMPVFPSGIKPSAIVSGEVAPDYDTEMLRCNAELHCTASLTCQTDEETGEFLDFVLKGTVRP